MLASLLKGHRNPYIGPPRETVPANYLGPSTRFGVPLPPRRMARGAQGNRTRASGPPWCPPSPAQADGA